MDCDHPLQKLCRLDSIIGNFRSCDDNLSTTVTNGNQAVHRRPLILQHKFGRRSVVARMATRVAPLIALYSVLPLRPSTHCRRRSKAPFWRLTTTITSFCGVPDEQDTHWYSQLMWTFWKAQLLCTLRISLHWMHWVVNGYPWNLLLLRRCVICNVTTQSTISWECTR